MPSFGAAPARPLEGLNAALAEIAGIARSDPALVGEGAVLLLEKVPPGLRLCRSCATRSQEGLLRARADRSEEPLCVGRLPFVDAKRRACVGQEQAVAAVSLPAAQQLIAGRPQPPSR